MKKKTLIRLIPIPLFLCIAALLSLRLRTSSLHVLGGDLVRYSVLFPDGFQTPLSYELPVICSKRISDLSVGEIQTSGEGSCRIEATQVTEGGTYKGKYYYYIHLKVSPIGEEPIHQTIDALQLLLDGTSELYHPASFEIWNAAGYTAKDTPSGAGDLLYAQPPEVIQTRPPLPDAAENELYLEAENACTITDFLALDFLDPLMVRWEVNELPVEMGAKGIALKKGDQVHLSYHLQYQEGIHDYDFLKTSRILTYQNKAGQSCLFVEPQGFIFIDFQEDHMIRSYIDQL